MLLFEDFGESLSKIMSCLGGQNVMETLGALVVVETVISVHQDLHCPFKVDVTFIMILTFWRSTSRSEGVVDVPLRQSCLQYIWFVQIRMLC